MTNFRLHAFAASLVVAVCAVSPAFAGEAEELLAARNPALAELRRTDDKAFDAAAAIILESRRQFGIDPNAEVPEDRASGGRDMGAAPGREFATGNPDILWLYNFSPEGMSDLISILKSAGQKPKP